MRSNERNSTPLPFTLSTTHPHQTYYHLQPPSISKTNKHSFKWEQYILTSIQQLYLFLSTRIHRRNKPLCLENHPLCKFRRKDTKKLLSHAIFFFCLFFLSPIISFPFLTHLSFCIHHITMLKRNCPISYVLSYHKCDKLISFFSFFFILFS